MRASFGIGAVIVVIAAAVLIGRGFGAKGTIVLSGARAELSMTALNAVDVFVTIQNGAEPELLIGARSNSADVEVINPEGPISPPIPANSTVSLSLDGVFLRLSGFETLPEEGQLIPISLMFETSGEVSSRALVGRPADLHGNHMALGMMEGAPLVEAGQDLPSIALDMIQQRNGTWEVVLETTDFTFDPDTPEPVHQAGHGHAHLYINGLKVLRMHEGRAVIGALPQGNHLVRVALNTNDHRPYVDDAGPIEARMQITVD